jgi:hypothetical protein
MAHILSSNDYRDMVGRSVGDFIAGMKPVTVRDFMEQGGFSAAEPMQRRTCLANDLNDSAPQSQVDRLISDLMDIIVRAGDRVAADSSEAVAEGAALSMMQALLQKQVCSSF